MAVLGADRIGYAGAGTEGSKAEVACVVGGGNGGFPAAIGGDGRFRCEGGVGLGIGVEAYRKMGK